MNRSTSIFDAGGDRHRAEVIPFARNAARRFRREAQDADGPLGQILLFTGVRYERMPEAAEPPLAQRRRS